MRRIWEPCSFVGEKGVCTVCFPTLYIFVYPHLQIAVSVDALRADGRRLVQQHGPSTIERRAAPQSRPARALQAMSHAELAHWLLVLHFCATPARVESPLAPVALRTMRLVPAVMAQMCTLPWNEFGHRAVDGHASSGNGSGSGRGNNGSGSGGGGRDRAGCAGGGRNGGGGGGSSRSTRGGGGSSSSGGAGGWWGRDSGSWQLGTNDTTAATQVEGAPTEAEEQGPGS